MSLHPKKELLEAAIAGYETMARIGEGFGVASHRLKGWHSNGTAGTQSSGPEHILEVKDGGHYRASSDR